MQILKSALFILIACVSSAALATADCLQSRMKLASAADKLECAEQASARAKLAKKMLEQRLGDFIERTNSLKKKDDGRRTTMADTALMAKGKLEQISKKIKKLDEANEKVQDAYLRLKGTEVMVELSDDAAKAATRLAGEAQNRFEASEKADLALKQGILALSKTSDKGATREAILNLRHLAKTADEEKQAWETAKAEVLTKTAELANAALGKYDPIDEQWQQQLANVSELSDSIVNVSNDQMVALMAATANDNEAPQQKDKLAKMNDFLVFLENHPLLNSELSGSGVQFSSTAGEGKVSFKQAFQWGRSTSQRLAITLSAPTGDNNPMKNSVLLDKLDGSTTVKLDYTKIDETKSLPLLAGGYTLWGGSGELGYQKFSYFDAASSFADPAKPSKVESHNRSYSMAAYAGISPADSDTLFLLRYARQYQREKPSTAIICPPMPATATWVACNSGPMGEPAGRKYNIWSAELRHQFKGFAAAGILSYDKTSKLKAIALPFYLSVFNAGFGVFGGTEAQFSAGLITGWRSDTGTSVGFFAGMPFSLAKVE